MKMKTESIFAVRNLTLDDMIRSDEFYSWDNERVNALGLNSEDWEHLDRIEEYAEIASDGETHAEKIESWRDFLSDLTLPEKIRERIVGEIDNVEKWHAENGSLNEFIG